MIEPVLQKVNAQRTLQRHRRAAIASLQIMKLDQNRADRLKGGWCTLAFIRPNGGHHKLVRVPISTVYNVKAVGVPDYTQATVDPIEVS